MKESKGSSPVCSIIAGLSAVVMLVLSIFLGEGEVKFLRITGAVILFFSIPFAFMPFITLKKYGSVESGNNYMQTNVLVEKGLYRFIRHPQYLGYIIFCTGFPLISQNIFVIIPGFTAVLFFYIHARSEDEMMLEKFGEEYRDYMDRVPGMNFISGIYRYLKG